MSKASMSIERLPQVVNPLRYHADLLYQAKFATQDEVRIAGERARALEHYAPHVTVGSDDPPMLYAMAKLAVDPAQRKFLRAFLDQLDAVDAAKTGQVNGHGGFQIERPKAGA